MTPDALAAKDPVLAGLLPLTARAREGTVQLTSGMVARIADRQEYTQGPYRFRAWILDLSTGAIAGVLEADGQPAAVVLDEADEVVQWFRQRQSLVQAHLDALRAALVATGEDPGDDETEATAEDDGTDEGGGGTGGSGSGDWLH